MVKYLGEHQEGEAVFDRIHSDVDRHRLLKLAEQAHANNMPVAHQNIKLRSTDGETRTFSVAVSDLSQGDARYLLWEVSPVEDEIATVPNITTTSGEKTELVLAEQYQQEVFYSGHQCSH